jgi:hypothetical protein
MRIGNLVLGKTDMVFMFLQGAPKVVYRRGNECGHKSNSRPSSATRVGPAGKSSPLRLPNLGRPCSAQPAMNSPHEPASPASSSTDSLDDDATMPPEYSGSPTHEKAERSSFITNMFTSAKSAVAKRRLPGGTTTKTTSNRDSKARRREEGGQGRRGGPSDRRDPTKGKDDLLDVALFELLKKSEAISFDRPPISLSNTFHRNRGPHQRRHYQAQRLSVL